MADLSAKLLHAEPGSSAAAPGYVGNAAMAPQNLDPSGKYVLKHQGAFAAVEVAIGPNDGLKSEGGAMVTMSNNVFITTHMEGGLGTSLLRCCCAGSSIFFNHYRLDAGHTRGDVLLAPSVPGEILLLNLDNTLSTAWTIASSNFLACDSSVQIGVRMLGIGQGCCGGEGFFVMEATGLGRLLVNSYGSIAEYRLAPGEVRKIDNGFLVCWSSGMPWTIVKATRSLTDTVLSGEGLVTSFTGPGTVYVQTRSLKNLASALVPYLPSTGGGGGGSNSSS